VKLIFDPEALLEARNAAAFYEDRQPGLGKAFLAGIEAATEEIIRHPLMWRRLKGRFRRYLIQQFPCRVIYRYKVTPSMLRQSCTSSGSPVTGLHEPESPFREQ